MTTQEFTTTSEYTEESTVGPWGYPNQVVLKISQPVMCQIARKIHPHAGRVIWEFIENEFPNGDYRLGRCHGIRFRTKDNAADITAITIYKEDAAVQSFSFTPAA